jgi:ankyrin repeat protein
LHLACNHKSPELIRYLISKGSDVEKVSIYGKPINWAAGSSNIEAIQILLENKVNPNGDLTCPAPAPLILAIDFGNKEMYDLLVSHGADINVKDPHGYSTLHVAAEKGDLEIVKDLVEKGVEVEYEVQGKSALFLAFENHKFQVVNYLK